MVGRDAAHYDDVLLEQIYHERIAYAQRQVADRLKSKSKRVRASAGGLRNDIAHRYSQELSEAQAMLEADRAQQR
jgi:hypothetical protein